ncbi:MAG TPA: capsule assembly Wzi family protein [Caldimonas sp.]
MRSEVPGLPAPDTPLALNPEARDGVIAAIGGPGKDLPPLLGPVMRGEGGVQLRATTSLLDGQVQVRFGAAVRAGDDHPWTFDESAISTALGAGRIYASVERRHWGPSWTGSLILDAAARPVPAVGWRKDDARPFAAVPFSWLGPWRTDVFIGQLTQRTGPEHAKLIGGRFQFMPLDGLEIAISRTLQWGGSDRPESASSLFRALLGQDNMENGDAGSEPGNQLAGYDARYTWRLGNGRSISIYGQAIGEDEANHRPSHFLASAGLDLALPIGDADVRFFVEHANTTARGTFGEPQLGAAYRHHIYTAGYTQLGDPLGHPLWGDALLTSVGAYVDRGTVTGAVMVHWGAAYPTAQRWPGGGKISGANAEVAWKVTQDTRLGVALMYWRDPLETRTRAQVWGQIKLP